MEEKYKEFFLNENILMLLDQRLVSQVFNVLKFKIIVFLYSYLFSYGNSPIVGKVVLSFLSKETVVSVSCDNSFCSVF